MVWRIWKRMLWSLFCFVLLCIGFVLGEGEGDFAGGMAALTLFILFPLWLIVLIWGLCSSIKLTHRAKKGEDISYAFDSRFQRMKDERKKVKAEVSNMDAVHKKRFYTFRISGVVLTLLGVVLICTCGLEEINTLNIVGGTLLLIAGLTLWFLASPTSFNGSQGLVQMILSPRELTIEELYETFKDMDTVWGSPYMAKFSTMERPVLALGPNEEGELVYSYLSKDQRTLYVSATPFTAFLEKKLTPQLHPAKVMDAPTLDTLVCYTASSLFLKSQLFDALSSYVHTGEVKAFGKVEPKHTYRFDESFKLTGQRFSLSSLSGETIYRIEGTVPLKSFTIRDRNKQDVFSVSKEILNLMPTYRFYKDGAYYGTLAKQFDATQDTFTMKTEDGELLMEEVGATFGHNYRIALGGRTIGYILDNLNLSIRNLVFDNSVIVIEEEKDLPVVTALAIMAAREIARDRDRASHNN